MVLFALALYSSRGALCNSGVKALPIFSLVILAPVSCDSYFSVGNLHHN